MVKRLGNQGVTLKEFKDIYDSFNQAIRDIGATNDILIIDLDIKVPKGKTHIYDCTHLNDNGSRLVAKIISEALRPLTRNIKSEKRK